MSSVGLIFKPIYWNINNNYSLFTRLKIRTNDIFFIEGNYLDRIGRIESNTSYLREINYKPWRSLSCHVLESECNATHKIQRSLKVGYAMLFSKLPAIYIHCFDLFKQKHLYVNYYLTSLKNLIAFIQNCKQGRHDSL